LKVFLNSISLAFVSIVSKDMQTPPLKRISELRAALVALVDVCPVNECNPEDCPLFKLRNMNPSERLQWFAGLGEDDLVSLAAYHHIYFNTKIMPQSVGENPLARM
jgi:hypothetical protein